MVKKTGSDIRLRSEPSATWGGEVTCPRCKRGAPRQAERCRHCGYSFRETRAYEAAAESVVAETDALIGSVINEKYRVVSILGEGGFGVVYKVEFLLFDTCNTFALKLLHPALSQDPKFRRRFLREAALAMQLIHENTIQIREFGRTEDGSLFFTMDYCEGEPLNEVIAREEYLSVNRALRITEQILSVMRQAHAQGIIHRDLKPENVFLERRGERRDFVKVGDFGLAKSYLDTAGTDITQGGILGTPRYMSPEQSRGNDDLDHRSDIYSIGVMLHEMLYGRVPRDSQDGDSSVVREPPPHPGHVVPRAVWQIVRKAIAPRREDRFQSADEFARALGALPEYTPIYVEPRQQQARSSSWWRGVAVVLVVALLGSIPFSVAGEQWIAALWSLGGSSTSAAADGAGGAGAGAGASSGGLVGARRSSGIAPGDPAAGTSRAVGSAATVASGPSANIHDYLPLHAGSNLSYRVWRDGFEDERLELRFRIEEEEPSDPGSTAFRVRVATIKHPTRPASETLGQGVILDERRVRWVLDESQNVFYEEFRLPDPQSGMLSRTERTERLRLPSGVPILRHDWPREKDGVKVHAQTQDVGEGSGAFRDCLLVETVEDGHRRLQYYKVGLGLVALEVYALPQDAPERADEGAVGAIPPGAPLARQAVGGVWDGRGDLPVDREDGSAPHAARFMEDLDSPGRLVYARYLQR